MVSRTLLAPLLLAVLASCASQDYTPVNAPGSAPGVDASSAGAPGAGAAGGSAAPTPARLPQPSVDKGANSASAGLLRQASGLRAEGDFDRADALLQRAQRIDPRNPEVYQQLAELHYARGDTDAGKAMAERGLLYCSGVDCRRLRELVER